MIALAVGIVVAVLAICVAVFFWQRADLAHQRWRIEHEAALKPGLELAKVKDEIDRRLADLEKRANGAALKSLGSR